MVGDSVGVFLRLNADRPGVANIREREKYRSVPAGLHEGALVVAPGHPKALRGRELCGDGLSGHEVEDKTVGGEAFIFLQHDPDRALCRDFRRGAAGKRKKRKSAEDPCAEKSFGVRFSTMPTHGGPLFRGPNDRRRPHPAEPPSPQRSRCRSGSPAGRRLHAQRSSRWRPRGRAASGPFWSL